MAQGFGLLDDVPPSPAHDISKPANGSPSPGGEGRDEGERHCKLFIRARLQPGFRRREKIPTASAVRVIPENHFRMEQMEAVLSGWARKAWSAVTRRSVKASGVRAM